jgi:hypothetical protein
VTTHQRKLDDALLETLWRRTDTRVRDLKRNRLSGVSGLRDHTRFAKNESPSDQLVARLVDRVVGDTAIITSVAIGTNNGMRGFFFTLRSV